MVPFKEVLEDQLSKKSFVKEYRKVLEEELGEMLRYLREEVAGLSHLEAAQRAGLKPHEVIAAENRFPFAASLEALLRRALALGLSVRIDFLKEDEVEASFALSPEEGRVVGVS